MPPTPLSASTPTATTHAATQPWYRGVTRYQWLVLIIASLRWVFDAFEGQLYNITRGDMLPDLLRHADPTLSAGAIATLTRSWASASSGSSSSAARWVAGSSARWRIAGAASP